MLIMSLTLRSSARPSENGELYRAEIINDGTGTPEIGNYKIKFYKREMPLGEVTVKAFVKTHFNALYLFNRAIRKFFEEYPMERVLDKTKRNQL